MPSLYKRLCGTASQCPSVPRKPYWLTTTAPAGENQNVSTAFLGEMSFPNAGLQFLKSAGNLHCLFTLGITMEEESGHHSVI